MITMDEIESRLNFVTRDAAKSVRLRSEAEAIVQTNPALAAELLKDANELEIDNATREFNLFQDVVITVSKDAESPHKEIATAVLQSLAIEFKRVYR